MFGLSKAFSFARLGSASTVPHLFHNFSFSLNTPKARIGSRKLASQAPTPADKQASNTQPPALHHVSQISPEVTIIFCFVLHLLLETLALHLLLVISPTYTVTLRNFTSWAYYSKLLRILLTYSMSSTINRFVIIM